MIQIKIDAGSNVEPTRSGSDVTTSSSIPTSPLVGAPACTYRSPTQQKQQKSTLIRAETLINMHADGASSMPEAFSHSCSGTWCPQSDYESHHLRVVMGASARKEVLEGVSIKSTLSKAFSTYVTN